MNFVNVREGRASCVRRPHKERMVSFALKKNAAGKSVANRGRSHALAGAWKAIDEHDAQARHGGTIRAIDGSDEEFAPSRSGSFGSCFLTWLDDPRVTSSSK